MRGTTGGCDPATPEEPGAEHLGQDEEAKGEAASGLVLLGILFHSDLLSIGSRSPARPEGLLEAHLRSPGPSPSTYGPDSLQAGGVDDGHEPVDRSCLSEYARRRSR